MKRTLLITACIVFAHVVQARVGETLDQCNARYGQHSRTTDDGLYIFAKSGFIIFIGFYEAQADCVFYSKAEKDALGQSVEMSDIEIQKLLDSNSSAVEWKEQTIISMDHQWKTEDGRLVAHYDYIDHYLLVCTMDYINREAAKKAKKETENLQGF